MQNVDYIEVRGPRSLAELVAAIDPNASTPAGDAVTLPLGGQEAAAVQYDAADADAWPYMITVESRGEDEGPVRTNALRIFDALQNFGWELRLTSDADDSFIRQSPVSALK